MLEKNSKEKITKLSAFLPKNLLSDLEDIPYSLQEKVKKLLYNFFLLLIYNNFIGQTK